jgi:4-amino-4-deoxy-L-arabinose transferase-like glycosyltransferase
VIVVKPPTRQEEKNNIEHSTSNIQRPTKSPRVRLFSFKVGRWMLNVRCCFFFLGVLAIYFLFFRRLIDRDLWSSHEARAGMDAQTILDGGSWGLPQLFDGRPELQKPPLYYWLVASLGWLRGGRVDTWAVRLPAAGAATLSVFAVLAGLAWGRRRPSAGLLAALVLATAVHFIWLARIGRIDMPLTLSVTLALGSFYLARDRENRARL